MAVSINNHVYIISNKKTDNQRVIRRLRSVELCPTYNELTLRGFVASGSFVAPNGVKNFAPVDRHLFRRLNAQTNYVASNFDDSDRNVIVDDNTLILLAGKYQHFRSSS